MHLVELDLRNISYQLHGTETWKLVLEGTNILTKHNFWPWFRYSSRQVKDILQNDRIFRGRL